jgi:TatA/E family protein of Tat protein translocase
MPFGFHPIWLVILLVIVLIIFGPGKLPELGGAIGRGIKEFRKTSSELTEQVKEAVNEQPSTSSHSSSMSENEPVRSEADKADTKPTS